MSGRFLLLVISVSLIVELLYRPPRVSRWLPVCTNPHRLEGLRRLGHH